MYEVTVNREYKMKTNGKTIYLELVPTLVLLTDPESMKTFQDIFAEDDINTRAVSARCDYVSEHRAARKANPDTFEMVTNHEIFRMETSYQYLLNLINTLRWLL